MYKKCLILIVGIVTFGILFVSNANAVMYFSLDFENLADNTPVTNQYLAQYVTFSGATAISSGFSLNELEFPPHSGQNVIYNNSQSIQIDFDLLTYDWSAYSTYSSPITINAYDAMNNWVGGTNGLFNENYVSSGNPANELLNLHIVGGFTRIELVGDPQGSSFVMDDMSYTTADAIPEPATIILLGMSVLGIGFARRLHR